MPQTEEQHFIINLLQHMEHLIQVIFPHILQIDIILL